MDLEASYKNFEDEKIIQLAQYEVEKLTPEAVKILKNEIINRKLNKKLIDVIDEQIEGISIDSFFEYAKFLLNLPCPICGKKDGDIDITRKGQVISAIVFTSYDKILICGCKDCLRKEIKRGMIMSLFLGWWGIPMGPIKTIQSIFYNLKKIKGTKTNDQSEDFIKFAYANKGYIMTNLDDEKELFELIKNINLH
jgi:hypothetical protein